MKLKLENPDPLTPGLTILVVSENIESSHVAILKAGLTKLFQAGKKSILLDFTLIPSVNTAVDQEIFALRGWSARSEAQAIVVSASATMGHAKTREEAIQILKSSDGPLLVLEAKLQAELHAAQTKKSELERKLIQANASGNPKELQQIKSSLTRSIKEAQRITNRFLKNRTSDPYSLPAFQLAKEALDEILVTVLKKERVLT